jgi:hypothetical protein
MPMLRSRIALACRSFSLMAPVAALLLPGQAVAARYATSQRPHWAVGAIDAGLSAACRRGRFNQIVDQRRHIAYAGEIGSGVTGIAKRGWNLREPDGQASAEATYHFADDGLSTCRVYVAKPKPLPSP